MGINRQLRLAALQAKTVEEFLSYNNLLTRSWSMKHEDGSYFAKTAGEKVKVTQRINKDKCPKPNWKAITTFLIRCEKHGLLDENDRVAQAWTKEPGQITLVPAK